MSHYFPKPFRIFGGNINVKFDVSNYATETKYNADKTELEKKFLM